MIIICKLQQMLAACEYDEYASPFDLGPEVNPMQQIPHQRYHQGADKQRRPEIETANP
jgi:hypothetical protein